MGGGAPREFPPAVRLVRLALCCWDTWVEGVFPRAREIRLENPAGGAGPRPGTGGATLIDAGNCDERSPALDGTGGGPEGGGPPREGTGGAGPRDAGPREGTGGAAPREGTDGPIPSPRGGTAGAAPRELVAGPSLADTRLLLAILTRRCNV